MSPSVEGFDEAKYRALLDGHECTEIMFSQLNKEFRIDSEYFYKRNLQMQQLIESRNTVAIGDIATVTDGIHTSIDYDENSQVNLISATSPRENVFNLTRNVFISQKAHMANPRTALRENDVIISTVGTIGNCAVVDKSILPANSDRHVGIIRLESTIHPYVLSTFLLSKYGKNQTVRETTGNVQPNLFLYKIKEIKVPVLGEAFQSAIKDAVIYAKKLLEKSRLLYCEAEIVLENEIGMDRAFVSDGGVTVKSFAESFGAIGRLDAEYYQPKYDMFEHHIMEFAGGYTTVQEEFALVKTRCSRDLEEYPYVEIGDISIENGEAECHIVRTKNLPANARIMTQSGDLLVSTVRPYRGAVSVLHEDNLLVSSAFTVLRENGTYPAQTLQVLFRTDFYKDWLLKFNVGTSYPVIKDEDVLNMPIPVLDKSVHETVKKYVQDSKRLLNKSKELLENAKYAVEMAIEQDEDMAVGWLSNIMKLQNEK